MRDYGKVYSAFWLNEEMRSVSEDARLLALYLMTSPHGNMLGCFRLTNAYAADDLQWESERVSKGFAELFQARFAYRCERSFWVFLRQYLKWNQFENPNVGKAAGKMFDTLPCPDQIKALLVNALREFSPHFPRQKLDEFETLSIPFENPFELSSKTRAIARTIATTEPEPTNVAPEGADGCAVVVVPETGMPDRRKQHRASENVQAVFDYWKQKMEHPRANIDAKRAKAIGARLADGYTVEDLCMAVDGCKLSPHHMGQNERRTVYDDIELICRDGTHVDGFIAKAKRGNLAMSPGLQQQIDVLNDWMSEDN